MNVKTMIDVAVGMILPSVCPGCGTRPALYSSPVCGDCLEHLSRHVPLPFISTEHIPRIFSSRPYTGQVKKCVRNFKYYGTSSLLSVFKDIILMSLEKNGTSYGDMDFIVPVPLHHEKLNSRGHNQSELIAGIVSKLFSVPVSSGRLIKYRKTPPQTGLPREKRMQNVRNSFTVIDPRFFRERSVLLVDDIMTTGTTLDACARELVKAGAKEIQGFTLARTL